MNTGIDQPAGIGELDAAHLPFEELDPEALLEPGDLVAQRGGRDMEFERRLRETQMASRGLEGA